MDNFNRTGLKDLDINVVYESVNAAKETFYKYCEKTQSSFRKRTSLKTIIIWKLSHAKF